MFEFLAIVGSFLGFIGGQKQASALKKAERDQQAAAEQSKRVAAKNAAAIEAETHERLRREKADAHAKQELTKARIAASGGELSGSSATYVDTMERTDDEFLSWLERSGRNQADIALSEGQYSYLTGMANARATGAQAGAAKFGSYTSLLDGAGAAYSLYDKSTTKAA